MLGCPKTFALLKKKIRRNRSTFDESLPKDGLLSGPEKGGIRGQSRNHVTESGFMLVMIVRYGLKEVNFPIPSRGFTQ
jgi:hypothetical protein